MDGAADEAGNDDDNFAAVSTKEGDKDSVLTTLGFLDIKELNDSA